MRFSTHITVPEKMKFSKEQLLLRYLPFSDRTTAKPEYSCSPAIRRNPFLLRLGFWKGLQSISGVEEGGVAPEQDLSLHT